MPRRSLALLPVILGLTVCVLPVATRADEASTPKPSADLVSFAAWIEHGEFIGDEQIRRLFVTSGTNQLGMVVPHGLRADLSRADRVSLSAPDMGYYLTLKMLGNSGFSQGWQQLALQHFPGAMLTEESSLEVAGKRGPFFKLRWKPTDSVDRLVSVTFVPTPAGWLEFAVVADGLKAEEAQSALTGMLGRLQCGERGRLKMETYRQPEYN